MKRLIHHSPKVALCRECKGTGYIATEIPQRYPKPCPQCEGSGRVIVSCDITLDIKAYIPIRLKQ